MSFCIGRAAKRSAGNPGDAPDSRKPGFASYYQKGAGM
jgi:hypothetical protein